jgi:hypothetical protein
MTTAHATRRACGTRQDRMICAWPQAPMAGIRRPELALGSAEVGPSLLLCVISPRLERRALPPNCAASRRQPSSFAVLRNRVFCTPALVSWQAEQALRSRGLSLRHQAARCAAARRDGHAASPGRPAAPAGCARTGASLGQGTRAPAKPVAQGGGDAGRAASRRTLMARLRRDGEQKRTPPPLCRWRPVSSTGFARAARCRPETRKSVPPG